MSSAFGVVHMFVLPYAVFAHFEAHIKMVRDFHPLIKRGIYICIFWAVLLIIEKCGQSLDRLLVYN